MEDNIAQKNKRAKLIRKKREERAWTQAQIAEISGVNVRTIQRLEKDGVASFDTLMAVASAFDIDVKELNQIISEEEKDNSESKVYHLHRLITGKHLTNVIKNADQFQFEHDDDNDPRSINAMKDILKLLKSDVVRLYDADPIEKLNVEAELTKEIKGLEDYGYYLFGIKRIVQNIVGKLKIEFVMCTIFMCHSKSPKLVKDENSNILVPVLLTDVYK